jgi:hypothetical protein
MYSNFIQRGRGEVPRQAHNLKTLVRFQTPLQISFSFSFIFFDKYIILFNTSRGSSVG